MTKKDKIIDYLNNVARDNELVHAWNEYCYKVNCAGDMVHNMFEFNTHYENATPFDIARVLSVSHSFNPDHRWFVVDVHGFLRSAYYPDAFIDTAVMTEYITTYGDCLGIGGIREILDSDED